MYAKLALRNIRRSLRDYGIYFLTLAFAIAIFYVFNSVGDQPAFLALEGSPRRMAQGAVNAIEWLTVFMTGVVALLVFYANRVIIKKRNRELGTYLLLGMEQGRLAFLLLAESAVIGLAALVVGLLAGILLSQFFALVVNRVFAAGLTNQPFVFSFTAMVRSFVYYGLLFVLVGAWQAAAVYRQKLIDLINGVRRNEEIRLRSRPLSAAASVVSLLTLGAAYRLAVEVSSELPFSPGDPRILTGAVLGVVGTYLLFVGLAGLLTGPQRRARGWPFRGLNLFLFRQVASKINTHTFLLATIALMLTFSISAMATGLGLGRGISDAAEREAPFDYMFLSASPADDFAAFRELFDERGVEKRREIQFQTAVTDLQNRDLMLPADGAWFQGDGIRELTSTVGVRILSDSAYRELRDLKGYPEVDLPEDGYLIHSQAAQTEPETMAREAFQRFLAEGSEVRLAGQALRPASDKVWIEPLGSLLVSIGALLVVPDRLFATLPTHESYLVVQTEGRAPHQLDQALWNLREELAPPGSEKAMILMLTRAEIVGQAFAQEGMLIFLTFYMGVMFILISATLLALQQVTDALEHRQRFQVLRRLGADEAMIDGTIARQLGLYFFVPVALALVHSLAALWALARLLLTAAGFTTIWPATLVTLAVFALIYGTYYLLSLQNCRMLFREPQAP